MRGTPQTIWGSPPRKAAPSPSSRISTRNIVGVISSSSSSSSLSFNMAQARTAGGAFPPEWIIPFTFFALMTVVLVPSVALESYPRIVVKATVDPGSSLFRLLAPVVGMLAVYVLLVAAALFGVYSALMWYEPTRQAMQRFWPKASTFL